MKKSKFFLISFVSLFFISFFVKKTYFKDDRIDVVGTNAHFYLYEILCNDEKDKFDEIVQEALKNNVSKKIIAYAFYLIGRRKYVSENYNDSIYYFSYAIKHHQAFEYYYWRVLSYIKLKQREKAINDLKKIEKLINNLNFITKNFFNTKHL